MSESEPKSTSQKPKKSFMERFRNQVIFTVVFVWLSFGALTAYALSGLINTYITFSVFAFVPVVIGIVHFVRKSSNKLRSAVIIYLAACAMAYFVGGGAAVFGIALVGGIILWITRMSYDPQMVRRMQRRTLATYSRLRRQLRTWREARRSEPRPYMQSRTPGSVPRYGLTKRQAARTWLNARFEQHDVKREQRAETRRVKKEEKARMSASRISNRPPRPTGPATTTAIGSGWKKTWNGRRGTILVSSAATVLIVLVAIIAVFGNGVLPSEGNSTAQITQSQQDKAAQAKSDKEKADQAKAAKDTENKAWADKFAQYVKDEQAKAKAQFQAVIDKKQQLTEKQAIVLASLNQRGITKDMLKVGGDNIDIDAAKAVDVGGASYGKPVFTEPQMAAFMKTANVDSKAAKARAGYIKSGATTAQVEDASNWVAVQFTVPIQWNGNTFIDQYGNVQDGGSKIDPAGTVALYFVGPKIVEMAKKSKAPVSLDLIPASRGACINNQNQAVSLPTTTVVQTIAYVKPHGGGNPPKPVCTEANNCKPVNPPVKCVDKPNKPCTPVTPPCKDTPNKPCNPTPPPVKCQGVGLDQICGTPNAGGDQQPVGDNGNMADPTPGYTPGTAEAVIGNQPTCGQGTVCGTEPTKDGTQVLGSQNGGGAPGGQAAEPATGTGNSGATNPNSDGTPHSTNPDTGTAAPVDSSTGHETTTAGSPDPMASVNLPNADTSSHSNASSSSASSTSTTSSTSSTSSTAGDSGASSQAPSAADLVLTG